MTLKLELSEGMSQLMTEQLRDSEFKSPESLAMAAIVEYLNDKAERAHIQMLMDEGDDGGPAIELTEEEIRKIFAEARADWARDGCPARSQ